MISTHNRIVIAALKNLFLGVVLLLLCSCHPSVKTYLETYNLTGSVKTLTKVTYNADKVTDGLRIASDSIFQYFNKEGFLYLELIKKTGHPQTSNRYFYNQNQLMIRKDHYIGDSLDRYTAFSYTKNRNDSETRLCDSKGNVTLTLTFDYDRSGRIISSRQYDLYNKLTRNQIWRYDDKNRITRRIHLDADNLVIQELVLHNNKAGNIKESFNFRHGVLVEHILFDYDNSQRLVRKEYLNADNVVTRTLTFAYDKNGNRIERDQKGDNEPMITYERIDHVYDQHGNWTVEETYINETIVQRIERTITYYTEE